MSDTETTVQDNATEQTGTNAGGEPEISERTTEGGGEPEKDASATTEPSGEGVVDGLNLKTLPKQYKDLQREYSRLQNEIVKKFEPYGGAEQVLQWTQYLSNNPDFATWVTQQKTKSSLGIDESQLDDQTRAALEAVRKIAKAVVAEEVGKVRTQEIAPLSEAAKQNLINTHFEQMDRVYGEEWHEMRDLMSELSESVPQQIQDRPTFDDIEDLYFKALRKSKKLTAYAAKELKKEVAAKKSKATDKPTISAPSSPHKATSIEEAFRQAKAAQNA